MARGRGRFKWLDGLSDYVGNVSLASLAAGIVALVTAGIVRLIAPELETSVLVFLALGLLFLLLAATTGFNTIRSAITTRRGFYGFNTTVMVLLFLAIASIIIFVGARNNARFDVTSTGEFSLAKQTVQILKDLENRIEAIAFFVPGDPNQVLVRGPALDLLEEYSQATGRFSYRVVDPELEPGEARRFGINPSTEPGTIIFATEGNLHPVSTLIFTQQGQFVPNFNLEKDFSQAILAVTRVQQKVVYFLERHGEADITNLVDGAAYGLAGRGLLSDNYLVTTLDLAGEGSVPEDASVLVIAGPKNDLLEEEREPLEQFLLDGGKALFLLDPDSPPGFRELLNAWGVRLGEGTVVDLGSSVSGNPRAPLVRRDRYNFLAPQLGLFSPITQPVTDSSFFERAAAVIPLEDQGVELNPPQPNVFYLTESLLITPLAVTSGVLSWLESDPEENQFDPGELRGPLALGVSIDARAPFKQEPPFGEQAPRTQIVVFGDSDFASNRFFSSFANGDMFLNSVNWLAGDVELISVRPKLRDPRLLIVTQGTWNFIRWSSLLILPIAVAAAGGFIWWRRR